MGLAVTATDNCTPPPLATITVWSNQAKVGNGNGQSAEGQVLVSAKWGGSSRDMEERRTSTPAAPSS